MINITAQYDRSHFISRSSVSQKLSKILFSLFGMYDFLSWQHRVSWISTAIHHREPRQTCSDNLETTRNSQIPYSLEYSYVIITTFKYPGPWFNTKMSSYQYRKSLCGDKTVVRSSYLHNGISYSSKMTFLYWASPQTRSGTSVALQGIWYNKDILPCHTLWNWSYHIAYHNKTCWIQWTPCD